MKIRFLGATRQVTGSRYLLEAGGLRLLVDCGMFQERAYQERNWEARPVEAESVGYLLLTHAHLDHVGLVPKFVGDGFGGTILATAATRDLAEIIMSDSAHIQVEDAKFKRKRHKREGRTGPFPVEPLYTADEVVAAMPLFDTVSYGEPRALNDHVSVTYHEAGHILGSSMLEITVREDGGDRVVVFSGDIGQWDKPIIRDPTLLKRADYVVMESTYGDRDHGETGPVEDQLCQIINETTEKGGKVLIPTFAVERAQELMYYIGGLVRSGRIPSVPVFLNSPMAVEVTDVFRRFKASMDEEALDVMAAGGRLFGFDGMKLVRSKAESKAINAVKGPCIIMAGSGMCTAGRIKHHLANGISDPKNTVVFVGYQANGTLGRHLVNGADEVRIHGARRAVKAKIARVYGFSAHADRSELLRWLRGFDSQLRRVFLTHGEQDAAEALAGRIEQERDLSVMIPEYGEAVTLD